jgi:hypothetical protein
MKKIYILLSLCLIHFITQAQAPQGIPYQSVIRNGSGALMINQAIHIRFSIHDSTMLGTIVYQESHTTTTSNLGMIALLIGQGTPVIGTFSAINWGSGAKFMQVELDAAGGSNYTDLGTQQMMSVPYSLYAGNGLKNGTTAGEMMYWNGTAWVSVAPGAEGQSLSFHNGTPTWESRLSVGMEYQGGVIAYLLHEGDIGYNPAVQHGLIAAPSDQSTGVEWGCYGTTISGADGTGIGTGNQNTIDIMNGCSTAGIAARICGDLVLNGYSDWYLPSRDELSMLYSNKAFIGGFAAAYYWSSSEFNNDFAWVQIFASGYQDSLYSKDYANYVRAVRAF